MTVSPLFSFKIRDGNLNYFYHINIFSFVICLAYLSLLYPLKFVNTVLRYNYQASFESGSKILKYSDIYSEIQG